MYVLLLTFYLIFNGAYFKNLVNMRAYCLQSELAFTDSQMHKGIEFQKSPCANNDSSMNFEEEKMDYMKDSAVEGYVDTVAANNGDDDPDQADENIADNDDQDGGGIA